MKFYINKFFEVHSEISEDEFYEKTKFNKTILEMLKRTEDATFDQIHTIQKAFHIFNFELENYLENREYIAESQNKDSKLFSYGSFAAIGFVAGACVFGVTLSVTISREYLTKTYESELTETNGGFIAEDKLKKFHLDNLKGYENPEEDFACTMEINHRGIILYKTLIPNEFSFDNYVSECISNIITSSLDNNVYCLMSSQAIEYTFEKSMVNVVSFSNIASYDNDVKKADYYSFYQMSGKSYMMFTLKDNNKNSFDLYDMNMLILQYDKTSHICELILKEKPIDSNYIKGFAIAQK